MCFLAQIFYCILDNVWYVINTKYLCITICILGLINYCNHHCKYFILVSLRDIRDENVLCKIYYNPSLKHMPNTLS